MNRFAIFLFCVGVLFLSGCSRHITLPDTIGQQLTPAYTESLPRMAEFLEFSKEGATLLVAGSYDFLHLYDATNFYKRVTMQQQGLAIQGVGYIDNNTWYFATDYSKVSSVHIRKIEPPHEIYKYDWERLSGRPVFANKNHIAHDEKMLNWHDGRTYKISVAHPGIFDYRLTPDSQVVTRDFQGSIYLFYDPVKQESMVWDVDSKSLILSPDARYALVLSRWGKCELLRMPQKEQAGNCGQRKLLGSKKLGRVAFQRDSRAFAIVMGNEIFVYATQPFKPLMVVPMKKTVDAMALGEDRLAVIDETGTLRVWSISENKIFGEYARACSRFT